MQVPVRILSAQIARILSKTPITPNQVTLFRDGRKEVLKIKMFRNSALEKKLFMGTSALRKRGLFFKRKKGEL